MASQWWVKKWVLIIIEDSGGRKLGGFSRSVPGLEAACRGLLGSAHADPLAITGAQVVHVLAGYPSLTPGKEEAWVAEVYRQGSADEGRHRFEVSRAMPVSGPSASLSKLFTPS